MSDRSRRDPYEQLFVKLCERVEKLLVRAICGAFALLLLSQLLLQFPWMRMMLTSVARLEGVPYRQTQEAARNAVDSAPSAARRN